MPTVPTKKKIKLGTAASIKEEPQETFPLSHFVDDPVELIRQVFLSLKSKTIKSIAPDFLQKCTLESIQEYCLDELLGISKKRLLSIINATKCPSDTEDSSSDVENIEEHISLEEISSDSADDVKAARRKKKSAKVNSKTARKATATATVTTSTGKDSKTGVKKMSVLELLELQARARAIRSQLALEPVTKIELDSDNEDDIASVTASTSSSTKPTASNSNSLPKPSSANVNNGELNAKKVPKEPEIKPVRLKRNFRQRQCSDYEGDEEDNEIQPDKAAGKETVTSIVVSAEIVAVQPPVIVEPIPSTAVEQPVNISPTKERSLSPDIITIVPSPETLCISSDSENEDQQFLKRIKASNYIKMPEISREARPETEDEIFLRKLKRSATGADSQTIATSSNTRSTKLISNSLVISVANDPKKPTNEPRKATDIFVAKVAASVVDPVIVPDEVEEVVETPVEEASASKTVEQPKEPDEQEEGELTEDDEPENEIVLVASAVPVIVAADSNAPAELDTTEDFIHIDQDDEQALEKKDIIKKKTASADVTADVLISSDSSASSDSSTSSSDSDDEKPSIPMLLTATTLEIDDDDDIIDLGKDEEMDFDADPVPSKKFKTDDEGNAEDAASWGTRSLSSKKVSKVMATSRLANKVRTKIKQNKKSKLTADADEAAASEIAAAAASTAAVEAASVSAALPSNFEEGSVKHYEDLIAANSDGKVEESSNKTK